MAPAAGMIAMGMPVAKIAEPISDPVLLDIFPASPGNTTARIIHIDAFGNATTNMDRTTLRSPEQRTFHLRGRNLGPLRRTYWDAHPGEPLAIFGSSGLLEIAVRDGSAADQLDLHVGDIVTLE
jgi:S-adenosyl-L-methionine hydrolase (adenosine-forming)